MAYCRGDVYMYSTGEGFMFHVGHCAENVFVKTHEEALAKLLELKTEGREVPDHAIQRLQKEIAENSFRGE